ncbi:MAG TPA: hypothetical protein VLD65_02775 [Anaerolineales bacterium]|nr:hypothetical protein [Anaerolineales bacterium]
MTFVLLIFGILLVGVLLVVVGSVLLLLKISKLAGFIVLGLGLLMVIISILVFLSLVITSRTMG